ncbi:MAG: phage minor head protein [Candidatus Competibacter sp.]|nr:phage minor head protein [Candidatus Competibacter sp.]MDG4583394.1 phage minor head protein [Candidatus Competibacter sp.]
MPAQYGSLTFDEALQYLQEQLALPTERWDDLLGAAHDRAFVVAGALQADLLLDLQAAVEKARAEGMTFEQFQKEFERIVAERGWTGWTGEDSAAGRAWRARVIYDTNLLVSEAAGRYQQMKQIADRRPYWRYRHDDSVVHPREEHEAWDGKVLRHDDPWWGSHYPPNGFGCHCFVESLAERDLRKLKLKVETGKDMPHGGTVRYVDKRTGEEFELPEGVDPGWDHAPGANTGTDLTALLRAKMAVWPEDLKRQALDALQGKVDAATWAELSALLK